MRLNNRALPAQLIKGIIDEGIERTRHEWAKELDVPEKRIDMALMALRKRGFMISPIGTINRPHRDPELAEHVQGKLKNILNSKADSQETVARNSRQQVMPRLRTQFRLLEEIVSKWPEMLPLARSEANSFMKYLISKEEGLKHLNENNRDSA